jgi:hypothetical protein
MRFNQEGQGLGKGNARLLVNSGHAIQETLGNIRQPKPTSGRMDIPISHDLQQTQMAYLKAGIGNVYRPLNPETISLTMSRNPGSHFYRTDIPRTLWRFPHAWLEQAVDVRACVEGYCKTTGILCPYCTYIQVHYCI